MNDRNDDNQWLTAAECAGRIGLTIRALRVYEKHGLISPKRTGKEWRLYGPAEIARLTEVLALKRLGLSLSGIASLLAGKTIDLDRMLTMQHGTLLDLRNRADNGLAIVTALRSKVAAGERLSTDELIKLAKETQMTDLSSEAVAWKRYDQTRPRTEVAIDPTLYADYAGHYLLDDGIGITVTERDGRLFIRVTGQPEIEAFAENHHQFFLKVVPAQITFVRAADGAVVSLVLHQGGFDLPARRVDEAVNRKLEDNLARRIRDKTPLPEGEATLRRLVDEHLRGEPDYQRMSPQLAALAREQASMVQADLARMGALKGFTFRGVAQGGWDVYDVHFENGDMEWGYALAPDGKISGLYLKPSP